MNLLEIAKSRYSCRAYRPERVEEAKINYIIECVRMAPSAVNRQPWRFRIVSSEEGKRKLQQCYSREWFTTAPMYVVASIRHDEEWVRADGKHHGNNDIAIAVEHLCLAATEQGLATCWVCNFDADLCKQQLALPEAEEPAVIVPLGYAATEPTEKKRKPMQDIISTCDL